MISLAQQKTLGHKQRGVPLPARRASSKRRGSRSGSRVEPPTREPLTAPEGTAMSTRSLPQKPAGAKPRRHGVYVLPYAMQALAERRITPIGALLLGHVDHFVNSFQPRRKEDEDDEQYARRLARCDRRHGRREVPFTTNELKRLLHRDDRQVEAVIRKLAAVTPWLLKFEHQPRGRWMLRTRMRSGEHGDELEVKGGLEIPADVLGLFEDGVVTALELLAFTKIRAFDVADKNCFPTNATLARWLGIQTHVIKNKRKRDARKVRRLLASLKAKDLITSTRMKVGRRWLRVLCLNNESSDDEELD
jgi:hypothetical protein